MNPVVAIHFFVGLFTAALAVPLILRKVKMNPWYGIRIPEAFKSEERWYEINRHGGWLLLGWGLLIIVTAAVGSLASRAHWVAYDWTALVVIVGGLVLLGILVNRHARKLSEG